MEKSKVLIQFLVIFRQFGMSFPFFMLVGFTDILRQILKEFLRENYHIALY